jgi:hypothetical protein
MHELLPFFGLAMAALFASADIANAELEIYRVNDSDLHVIDHCSEVDTWGVAQPPQICNSTECITTFFESDLLFDPTTYRANYPNPYGGELWYEIIESSKSAANVSLRSRLIPVGLVESGPDPSLREAEIAKSSLRRFFNVQIGSQIEARAICDTIGLPSGEMSPVGCIVVRAKIAGDDYFLAPVTNRIDERCPDSSQFHPTINFGVPDVVPMESFLASIVDELTGSRLAVSRNSVEFIGSEQNPVIIAGAGPSVSAIDPRLREKIDLVISGDVRLRAARRDCWSEDPEASAVFRCMEDEGSQLRFVTLKFRIAAWVGRQNVDPAGEWVWPDEQHYNAISNEVIIAFDQAFRGLCAQLNQHTEQVVSFEGTDTICSAP